MQELQQDGSEGQQAMEYRDAAFEEMLEAHRRHETIPSSAILKYVDGILMCRLFLIHEHPMGYGEHTPELKALYEEARSQIEAGTVPEIAYGIIAQSYNHELEGARVNRSSSAPEDMESNLSARITLSSSLRSLAEQSGVPLPHAEDLIQQYDSKMAEWRIY